MKEFIKVSETEIGVIDSTPIVASLSQLKAEKEVCLSGIARFQAQLLEIEEKISQAEGLGVVESVSVNEVIMP